MINADLQLWRAVVAQAFTDLMLPSTLKDKTQRRARRNAIAWLTEPSEDLATVCALAELSPHSVIQHAKDIMSGRQIYDASRI